MAQKKTMWGRFYFPRRYILALLAFVGMFNVYAMRFNLSVAMVAMVNITEPDRVQVERNFTECIELARELAREMEEEANETKSPPFRGEQFNWSPGTQGVILGAFFYGYMVTQVPGGLVAERWGAKWFFGSGVLITALLSLLTPAAAHSGVPAFVVVRILEGLAEGVTFPSMHALVSCWSPKLERSRISAFVNTGAQFGAVISMPLSGYLSSVDFLGGWCSAFYVSGFIACVWFVFWGFFVYNSPSAHPGISKEELQLFEDNETEPPSAKPKTPWKSILTSVPFWAVLVAHFGHNFGFLILLTELPIYLSTILHFNIKQDGLLCALPYIIQAVSAWIAACLADRLRQSGKISITNIRKIINSVGLVGPAICLLAVTVSGCQPMLIVALITMAMGLNGFVYSGYNVTHMDMAPDFAGTMYGIINMFGNTCGVIGPAVVGAFTKNGATRDHWASVFYITASIYVGTATFYALFASAELQPWGASVARSKCADKKDNILETVN